VPSNIDAAQEAERLIAWTHDTLLSPLEGGVSGAMDLAGALYLPALAMEAMTDGVVIYRVDRRIAHLNAAACRILELDGPPEDVPGVAPSGGPWRFDACDRRKRLLHLAERALQPLLHGAAPAGSLANDIRITTRAGRGIPLRGYVRPIHDAEGRMVGSVAVIRAVTEQERLERATAPWARQLGAALDAIIDAANVFDGGERVVALNQGARMLLESAEVADRSHPPVGARPPLTALREVSDPALSETRAPASRTVQEEALANDARLTITGAPLRVTRRRSSGGTLERQDAMERRQQRRAHEIATAWDNEFIAEAMHELRNVTTSLCGFVDLLSASAGLGKQSKLSKGRIESIEEIERAAGCLAELTDHIDDVMCLRADRFAIRSQAADLVALVRRVVKRLQVTTQRHAIAVSTTAASIMAQIDIRRIEQVLTNLIGNAIKYDPDGGEIMVKVGEDQERGRDFVAVRDHGIGIPTDQRGLVFQRFGRADNARKLGVDGAGLGLYLCREIVERHGGHIWFRSRAGRGTTFCISLPVVVGAREMREGG
jgi:signal transduction histidine kinase